MYKSHVFLGTLFSRDSVNSTADMLDRQCIGWLFVGDAGSRAVLTIQFLPPVANGSGAFIGVPP